MFNFIFLKKVEEIVYQLRNTDIYKIHGEVNKNCTIENPHIILI